MAAQALRIAIRPMNGNTLGEALSAELTRIPVENWHDYFPVQVAVLRFLENRYPGRIGLSRAGFDDEGPYVQGPGVEWFADDVWSREDILELVDELMTSIVLELKERYPFGVDTPSGVVLPIELVTQLERRIVESAETAIQSGRL